MSDQSTRVGELDRRFAGGPIVCVIGPVHGSAEALLPRLRAMFRGATEGRVGAVPDRSSTRWRRAEPDESWLVDGRDFAADDVAGAVRLLHGLAPYPPIQVGVVDRHLLIRVDHGVGDMGLIFEIAAALSQPGGATPTGFVEPPPRFGLRRPVARVVLAQLAGDPLGTARAAVAVLGARLRRTGAGTALAPAGPRSVVEPYSIFVRSDADYLTALTAARARTKRRGSVSALLASAVADELSAMDPRLGDVHVVVSLRGRVPGDLDTAGNLTAVVSVPVGSAPGFTDRFDDAVRSSEVPVQLAMSLALSAAARRDAAPGAGTPSISLSNLTRASTSARIGWASADGRVCAVSAPLSDAGSLAVVLTQVESQVQATVHFDAAVYDAAAVEKAVREALRTERWIG